jgi:hypothetical protein
MPLVPATLQLDLESVATTTAHDAMLAMLNKLSGASKDVSASNEDVATEFASKFKAGFAADAATAIDKYIKTATVMSVPVLVCPVGPVTGMITNTIT